MKKIISVLLHPIATIKTSIANSKKLEQDHRASIEILKRFNAWDEFDGFL